MPPIVTGAEIPREEPWTRDDESAFRESLGPAERYRLLWTVGVGMFVFPAFVLLDWVVYPELFYRFFALRCAGVVVLLAVGVGGYYARRYWTIVALEAVIYVSISWIVAAMGHSAGQASPYFTGILVVQIFWAVLSTMPLGMMVLLNGLMLASYFVPLLRYPSIDSASLADNAFFLGSGAIASTLGTFLREQLARREYTSRRSLSRTNAELKSLHELKNRMFQNVSHEFRTPLTLILAPIERLIDTRPPPSGDTLIFYESIRDNGLRLLNLINDLLELARLSEIHAPAEKRPVPVSLILSRVARDATELARRQGLRFTVAVPPELPNYLADPRHLEKVVLNLLSNAFKFTPQGGEVTLEARDEPSGLVIRVSDTGPGIVPELRANLFQRFQQLDATSTRRFGGTGIGLALVKELTTQMGGEVALESSPGQGSTFSIRFPASLRTEGPAETGWDLDPTVVATLSREAAVAALGAGRRTDEIQRAGKRGPRVLVAEDDPGLVRQLLSLLSPTYQVTAVSDGRRALALATREPPHVIVTDLMMPGLDGLELTAALRDLPALRDTAILMLTARTEVADRVAGHKAGADTYLAKPFHPEELLAAVEGLLRSRLRLVGRYLLHKPLGSGGQGDLFVGEHLDHGGLAAVKMLGRTYADPAARGRLKREAEVLEKLQHPRVVRVLEHGFASDRAYLAMELLHGASVKEILKERGPLAPGTVAAVTWGLTDALSAVHAAGLVHRDVKCENVMVLRRGASIADRVRLIDFGIVRGEDQSALTAEGRVVGTLAYVAPEIVAGGAATALSDLYAAGVAAYVMCTGDLPFHGNGAAVAGAIVTKGVPRVDSRRTDLPRGLADVIARATAGEPDARFQRAEDFRDALAGLGIAPGELVTPDGPIGLDFAETTT